MTKAILPHLPIDKIEAAFARSPGNEIASGKLDSPESSAALAANMFGIFLDAPEKFPALPGGDGWGSPAAQACIEFEAPFPWWPRGRHPWLDAAVITQTHLIGFESKRFEPFRGGKPAKFSETYWRDVWGARMGPFLATRDRLRDAPGRYRHLDAAQLVKHAFGLRTEAARWGLDAALVYVYAEPLAWPDGGKIDAAARERHRAELVAFEEAVAGAEVGFIHLSYRTLLALLDASGDAQLRHHAAAVRERFPDI